eukprot:6181750-Pleurochrysis_carterae.AAC.2
MAAMVALVAVEAAFALFASARSNSLPLPLQTRAYIRQAAGHRLGSSAIRGGKPEADADGVAETGAAAAELAGVVVKCDCERVWRVVSPGDSRAQLSLRWQTQDYAATAN